MNVLPVVSNTPEWMAMRALHDTASEAPAALGESKHTSRTDLMKQKATGLLPEVNGSKQAIFNRGHEAEASARELAEDILDTELYPITANLTVDGLNLLASLDGATMDEEIIWEHKLYSESLAADVRAGTLAPHYTLQLDQQLLVSGAKKCLFMTSDGTADKMEWCWYESSPEKFAALVAGWKQFRADLAKYVPAPVVVAAVGHTPETLPALLIEVTGMVTNSNLEAYKAHALAVIDGINDLLVTDQNFADAEKAIKWCGGVEDDLKGVKRQVIVKAGISGQIDTIDYVMDSTKCKRINLEKKVVKQKDQLRFEIVTHGATELAKHIDVLNQRLGKPYLPPVTAVTADFAGAIKGKRTIESMQNAVATTLAQAKIEANASVDRIQLNLAAIDRYPAFDFLFADVAQLVLKDPNDLHAIVQNRVEQHARQAPSDSLDAIARVVQVEEHVVHIATPAPSGAPTLRLGQICARLDFTVTADFLSRLGFDPAATDKNAKLYHEEDFPRILDALVKHITLVSELHKS